MLIYTYNICVCITSAAGSSRCARGDNRSGRVRSRAALLLLLLSSLCIIIFYCRRRPTRRHCCCSVDDDAVNRNDGAVWSKKLRLKKLHTHTHTRASTPSAAQPMSYWNLWALLTHTHAHTIHALTREYILIRREYGYYTQRKTAGVLSRSHGLCVFIILTTMKKKKKTTVLPCTRLGDVCDDGRSNLYNIYINRSTSALHNIIIVLLDLIKYNTLIIIIIKKFL